LTRWPVNSHFWLANAGHSCAVALEAQIKADNIAPVVCNA
jgi:hypothetical protein